MTLDPHVRDEPADQDCATCRAWQDNYDGMYARWGECDAERLRLVDELREATLCLRLLTEQQAGTLEAAAQRIEGAIHPSHSGHFRRGMENAARIVREATP